MPSRVANKDKASAVLGCAVIVTYHVQRAILFRQARVLTGWVGEWPCVWSVSPLA